MNSRTRCDSRVGPALHVSAWGRLFTDGTFRGEVILGQMMDPRMTGPDDLYSLRLDEFIDARDRMAAQLAAEGRQDEAVAVSKLRKPSVAAWALNQASRNQTEAVQRLVATHRHLREASSAELLRQASDERRRAVAELEAAAVEELTADGRSVSGPTRSRIRNTLLAIATDPQGEEDLVAGRLVREIEPSGGGWGEIGIASPPPERSAADRAVLEAQRARTRADRLDEQAKSAERGVESAARALDDARRRARDARARAGRAEAEAQEAERAAGLSRS